MNFSKEIVQNKILPHLFYNRKGNRLFDSAKKYLEQSSIGIDPIIQEYKDIELDDEIFWKNIINILSIVYDKKINTHDLILILKSDVDRFFEELLCLRFEYEFDPDDEFILNNMDSFDNFLAEQLESKDNLIIKNDRAILIFLVDPKYEKTYIEPFHPGEVKFFPVSLIKVDKESKKILLHGSKAVRTHLLKQINDFNEFTICKENISELASFNFDISQLFHILRDKRFYLKNVKFDGALFNLNIFVTGNNVLEISEFINPELILCDISDFIKLKQMKFDYYLESGEDIPLNIIVETYHQIREGIDEKYFKIILKITSRRKNINLADVEQLIIKELNTVGIEINKAYNMPNSYYFENFVHAKDDSRSKYLEILRHNPESRPIIKKFYETGILSDDCAKFDYNKYIELLTKILRLSKNKRIEVKDELFEILEINRKKTSIQLRIKIYSDDRLKKYTDYYSVIIPFDSRLSKMERIYNVIIPDLNIYKILLNYESAPIEVVNEVYNNVKMYIQYHYRQRLGKEANISHQWLVKYSENPFEFKDAETPKKSGYTVEHNVNVLLKFLFGNYIAVGGRNKPDGFLGFEGDIGYVIDSKQHQNLEKSEFAKLRDYTHSYRTEENLYDIKGGVLIICKKILETGSLNPSSREDVLKDTDAIIGYLSLEFLLELYEYYSKYFNSDLDIRTRLRTTALKVIEKSSELAKSSELDEIENEQIGKLSAEIIKSSASSIPKKEELL